MVLTTDPKDTHVDDSPLENPKPFGRAFTTEELASLSLLVGGRCPIAAPLGVPDIVELDDPVFDVGFRSLLVRGLITLAGDQVGVEQEARLLGELLVHVEEAWTLTVETMSSLESFCFAGAPESAACLVPGPVGIYSYRPIQPTLVEQIVGLLVAAAPDGESSLTAVVQRVHPQPSSPGVIRVDVDGAIHLLAADAPDKPLDKHELVAKIKAL